MSILKFIFFVLSVAFFTFILYYEVGGEVTMNDIEQRKVFSRNLNRYLTENDKTQREVADAIGVIPSTFNTWCQGIAIPRMGKVQALADYFHINKSDLIEEHSNKSNLTTKAVTINVLGRVAAGIPIEATTEIIDTEEIPEEMAKTGDFFALKIKGNSMEPRIMDGDVVIVRKQDEAENGDVIIAMVNGDDATCKRLRKYKDGIELISNNPSYKPMFFSDMDVQTKPVRIIGKVVELRGKF